MGVAWRETTLLVQGADLGAALGPILGWYILEERGAAWVFMAQALLHGLGAVLALATAYATRHSSLYRMGGQSGDGGDGGGCRAVVGVARQKGGGARGGGAAKYAAVCPEETETEVGGGGGRREEEEGGDPASRANV